MSDIFKSYLSEEERAIAIEESRYEIQMAKLNAMYEMVDKNLELNMLEAEAKVLTESGTYDDLDYLYEEANNEAAEKKEGIISKIIGVVKQIWQAITNTITNFFSKNKVGEGEAEVDENDEKRVNALNGVWGKIKLVLNFVRNNGAKIAMGVAAIGTLILGGLELFGKKGKKVKRPSSVVKGWIQSIKSKAGEVNSALKSAIAGDEDHKKALEILSTVGEKLKDWVTSLTSALGSVMVLNKVISPKEGKENDNADKKEGKENANADNGEVSDQSGNDANDAQTEKEEADRAKKNDKIDKKVGKEHAKAVKQREKNGGVGDPFGNDARDAQREKEEADRAKKNAKIDKKADKAIEKMKKSEGEQANVDENETADKIKEKHSWLADDGEENKNNKKKKKKQRRFRNKQSVSQESFEEEIDDETVLESTDTIFGYDLSNEIEIQENEVYESVMEEIDDLLGDL